MLALSLTATDISYLEASSVFTTISSSSATLSTSPLLAATP